LCFLYLELFKKKLELKPNGYKTKEAFLLEIEECIEQRAKKDNIKYRPNYI